MKTALIVVHGVADQSAGRTASQVAELLVASSGERVRYTVDTSETISIPVPRLDPLTPSKRVHDATPTSAQRPRFKSWLQSFRSDFQRDRWEAAPTARVALREVREERAGKRDARRGGPAGAAARGLSPGAPAEPARPEPDDRGLALTDFLLAKQIENDPKPEFYTTAPMRMTRAERDAAGATQHATLDVFEMYWADLSRLSGSVPRIVSELTTLVFRLSRLGRDTVDEARGEVRANPDTPRKTAWSLLAALQSLLDWLHVNLLGQLFAQLFLFGAFVVLLGLLVASPGAAGFWTRETIGHAAIGGTVGVLGVLLLAFRWRAPTRSKILPVLLIAVALAYALAFVHAAAWTAVVALALLSAAYDFALRVADERFPFTRTAGLTLWFVLLAVIGFKALVIAHAPLDSLNAWRDLALYGVELTLSAIKGFWILCAPLVVVWLVVGLRAQSANGVATRASVATGRLGLGVSIFSFLALAMAVWALLTTVLDLSAQRLEYTAQIFTSAPAPLAVSARPSGSTAPAATVAVAQSAPTSAPSPSSIAAAPASAPSSSASAVPRSSAQVFLDERYRASTAAFSGIAALLLVLLAFVVGTVTPSVLAELMLFRGKSRSGGSAGAERAPNPLAAPSAPGTASPAVQLGRWLTAGYRRLDGVTFAVCAAGALLAVAVMVVFAFGDHLPDPLREALSVEHSLPRKLSQSLLAPLVISAAGVGAALSILGGYLSKNLPAVRAPLDAALDVDNYFREFPRRRIARARIFARYVALLEHVAQRGYTRLVIVSHSQGTVISADLLRWLARGRALGRDNAALSRLIPRDLRLLTLGCPLRQLYAARFPTLYRWVIAAASPGRFGPRAADLGAVQWLNAYTSGDYVGRWLWTADPAVNDALGQPLMEAIKPAALGRGSVYDALGATVSLDEASEAETCLGVGAHTHYFESDQHEVAALIDHLVAGPGIAAPAPPAP